MADKFFKPLVDAAHTAFQNNRRALGQDTDPQVALYKKLKEADFQAIEQKYGQEGLAEYIMAMEKRQLRGG